MKKLIALVLALVCVLAMAGCNTKSMNYIIENKPSVTGVVEEVHEDYIIVYSEEADGYPNGSHWSISLNVENKDSYTDVVVGDEIVFYYDGMAMETDPLRVSTVYAITLKTPADRTVNEAIEETDAESLEETIVGGDLIPMVMVNGEIYMDTGHESTLEARCGMKDGIITSTVDRTEMPTKDNESNFGTGYGYQYATEGTIEVYMNDKWCVFATEKALENSSGDLLYREFSSGVEMESGTDILIGKEQVINALENAVTVDVILDGDVYKEIPLEETDIEFTLEKSGNYVFMAVTADGKFVDITSVIRAEKSADGGVILLN